MYTEERLAEARFYGGLAQVMTFTGLAKRVLALVILKHFAYNPALQASGLLEEK